MSRLKHVVLIHGAWSRPSQWAAAGRAFEDRGYTVHTPALRHHELPVHEGASRIATLSLRDYVDDLVAQVISLDSPPLLVGHSLGGILAQLVAARTDHAALIAACPAPLGIRGINATSLRVSLGHLRQPRPLSRPIYPMGWDLFRSSVAPTLSEDTARELYADLVCESSRALLWELAHPHLDRTKAAAVDFDAITTPVLVIGSECDRIVQARHVRKLPARYRNASYVEIPGSDHMIFTGGALTTTMAHVDKWLSHNQLVAAL